MSVAKDVLDRLCVARAHVTSEQWDELLWMWPTAPWRPRGTWRQQALAEAWSHLRTICMYLPQPFRRRLRWVLGGYFECNGPKHIVLPYPGAAYSIASDPALARLEAMVEKARSS